MLKSSTLKRLLVFIVTFAMVLSFISCTGKKETEENNTSKSQQQGSESQTENLYFNKEGYPICDKPIFVEITGPQSNTPDWSDTILVQEVEKRLGIKLICNLVETEAWPTQLTLMLSTDSLPDMAVATNISPLEINKYGEDGLLLPINNYIEYAPNLKAHLDKYPELNSKVTASDGNIYGLIPLSDVKHGQIPRTWLNNEWLKRVNMPYPKTLDELYDVLAAFKEQDANGNGDPNDEIPYSASFGDANFAQPALLTAFNIFTSVAKEYTLQETDGKVYLAEASDNFRNYLSYMRRLYADGLIDQEIFVHTEDQYDSKITDDKVGMFGHWAPFVGAKKDVSYDKNFVWLGGLTSEYNQTRVVPLKSQVKDNVFNFVNVNTKYPEAIVRLLDYFYTDEGEMAGRVGYEGITFDYVELEGIPGSRLIEQAAYSGDYESNEKFRYEKAVINQGFMLFSGTSGYSYEVIEKATPEQIDNILIDKYGWCALIQKYCFNNNDVELKPAFPTLVYTNEESDTLISLKNDISLFVKNAKAMFITGELDINSDSDWDEYVGRLNQMGLDKLIEIEQTAYDRYSKE